MIDTKVGAARLLAFLPDQALPDATLLELTGDKSKVRNSIVRSGLQQAVAEAWATPMADLTCAQCRVLVGQQFGLRWLSRPVAIFVARYPQAECDRYPGDLTMNAVIAWREMSTYAPEETAAMLGLDFEWLRREGDLEDWQGGIVKKAVAALDEARQHS